jgi:hypothetical protein
MLRRAVWPNMGGQTEHSEEEEQNLDTGFLKCAECGIPQQSCDMRRF